MSVNRRTFLAGVGVGVAAGAGVPSAAAATGNGLQYTSGPVVGAYYTGSDNDDYPVSKIPADTVTHVFYAFANINEAGEAHMSDSYDAAHDFAELKKLKESNPHLRTLISIGGWGAGGFSDAALTIASRRKLVHSCIALFFERYRGSFDGVDIDWEFPVYGGVEELTDRPVDRRNMTLLAQEFRRQLDELGRNRGRHPGDPYLVTAALPTGRLQADGPYDPAVSFELGELARVLDFINVMTYDMGTGFSEVATFNAPMRAVPADPLGQPMKTWNNVSAAIDYYQQHGVPPEKMVLGVPFYGRGFRTVSDHDAGLYQNYGETVAVPDWQGIEETLLTDPGFEQHWHPAAQAPWLYNPADHVFVSYEDPRSITIKSRFAKTRGLRGAFMWELTGDDPAGTLLEAMATPFTTGS